MTIFQRVVLLLKVLVMLSLGISSACGGEDGAGRWFATGQERVGTR
jgi:hypothetical protein